MTGDFLDRLNREAYKLWIEKRACGARFPRVRKLTYGQLIVHFSRLMDAQEFVAELAPRHRVTIASPAYRHNWRAV